MHRFATLSENAYLFWARGLRLLFHKARELPHLPGTPPGRCKPFITQLSVAYARNPGGFPSRLEARIASTPQAGG
jgi:hypothetical protein